MPSASIGVHDWVRDHCDPQPLQWNTGRAERERGCGSQAHRARHGFWASTSSACQNGPAGVYPDAVYTNRQHSPRHAGLCAVDLGDSTGNVSIRVQDEPVRLTAFVRGAVQGVGYRWWVRSRALELGLVGHAANLDDGRVEVVVEGARPDCERLLELLGQGPTSAVVGGVCGQWSARRGTESTFVER